MGISTFKRSVAAAGAFGVVGASLFGASGAVAADYECEVAEGLPAATVLDGGICEIVITTADGLSEVTIPSELGQVAALVVGAGGGGIAWEDENDYAYAAYGGGGGQVQYIDEVELDTPLAVEIGEGGEGDTGYYDDGIAGVDGGDTTFGDVVALGGKAAYDDTAGMSYEYGTDTPDVTWDGYDADYDSYVGDDWNWSFYLGFGGGTAGDALDGWDVGGPEAGPGVFPSDIGSGDLFPAAADQVEYGKGGSGYFVDGGEIKVLFDVVDEVPEPIADSGQGGDAFLEWTYWGNHIPVEEFDGPMPVATMIPEGEEGWIADYEGLDGQDGVVVLRFSAAELAATGVDTTGALVAGGVAAAAGATLVALASRRRRSA